LNETDLFSDTLSRSTTSFSFLFNQPPTPFPQVLVLAAPATLPLVALFAARRREASRLAAALDAAAEAAFEGGSISSSLSASQSSSSSSLEPLLAEALDDLREVQAAPAGALRAVDAKLSSLERAVRDSTERAAAAAA